MDSARPGRRSRFSASLEASRHPVARQQMLRGGARTPRRDRSVRLEQTFERLAERLGERLGAMLGESLARALEAESRNAIRRCSRPGCLRQAAARGLCKSHYNLQLYHRRKARGVPRDGRS